MEIQCTVFASCSVSRQKNLHREARSQRLCAHQCMRMQPAPPPQPDACILQLRSCASSARSSPPVGRGRLTDCHRQQRSHIAVSCREMCGRCARTGGSSSSSSAGRAASGRQLPLPRYLVSWRTTARSCSSRPTRRIHSGMRSG